MTNNKKNGKLLLLLVLAMVVAVLVARFSITIDGYEIASFSYR